MQLHELRSRHDILHYRSYTIERTGKAAAESPSHNERIVLHFEFELSPGIVFRPSLSLDGGSALSDEQLAPFAFHVGMAELASYWKAACPKEILISAGALRPTQRSWWHDLLLHGMGEFYYQNKIDFTRPDFLKITSSDSAPTLPAQTELSSSGGLILTAGGKDSSLTLELLREQEDLQPLLLNPSRSALESANLAGFRDPVILRRRLDPTLLDLNRQGYLNGHTPFSSYLAFASSFAAAALGKRFLIVSNEKSANQENLIFHDLPVNHQYSKSVRFERMFRSYSQLHLSPSVEYFSMLRPLYDLQVSGLFAHYCKANFRSFRSCNVGAKQDRWCGQCPKCAFTFLALAAFLPYSDVLEIFGQDLSRNPSIDTHLRELIGLSDHKPFECVGTKEESLQAVRLLAQRAAHEKDIPQYFSSLAKEAAHLEADEIALDAVSEEHFIPEGYLNILEDAVAHVLG